MANNNKGSLLKAIEEHNMEDIQMIPSARNTNNIVSFLQKGVEFACSAWVYEDFDAHFAWSKCESAQELRKHTEYMQNSGERELQYWDKTVLEGVELPRVLEDLIDHCPDFNNWYNSMIAWKSAETRQDAIDTQKVMKVNNRAVTAWLLENTLKSWIKKNLITDSFETVLKQAKDYMGV